MAEKPQFTPDELRELARACRALAYHISQTAKAHEGTSVHARTVAEQRRFEDLAAKCERLKATPADPPAPR